MSFGVCFDGVEDYDRHKVYLGRSILSDHGSAKLYVGILRLIAFITLYLIDRLNRFRLQRTDKNRVSVILPIYYDYLGLYILLQMIFVILDASSATVARSFANIITNFVVFHFLSESLTVLLLQAGAGYKDFYKAMKYGALIGAIGLFFYFICVTFAAYEVDVMPILAISIFNGGLIVMYAFLLFAPPGYIFRRSATYPYAAYMLVYNISWLIMNIITYMDVYNSFCVVFFVYFILDGITQPIIVYITLIIDSQYWQGLLTFNASSPLAGLWDVDLDVATAISSFHNTSRTKMPVIYFGLIDFDSQLAFAAGGFSRVYFGKLKKEKVAIKMLFVIDLTPESIASFYEEAQILNDLRDESVVECKGITIVPPALGLVMEYCLHGSLFHFLHHGLMSAGLSHLNKVPKQGNNNNNSSANKFWTATIARMSTNNASAYSFHTGQSTTSSRQFSDGYSTPRSSAASVGSTSSSGFPNYIHDPVSGSVRNSQNSIKVSVPSKRDSHSILSAPLVEDANFHSNSSTNHNRAASHDLSVASEVDAYHNPVNPLHSFGTTTSGSLPVPRVESDSESGDSSTQFVESSVDIQLTPLTHDQTATVTSPVYAANSTTSGGNTPPIGGLRSRSRTSSGDPDTNPTGTEGSRKATAVASKPSRLHVPDVISSISNWISDKFYEIREPSERLSVESRETLYFRPAKGELADLLPYEMMLDAARGVAFLHSKGYVHCDIKSLNFLVNEDLRVKIADLGEARPIDLELRRKHKKANIKPRPAINWCPPEILRPTNPDEYSTASDVFSLGMVMSEIILRQVPLDEIASRLSYETWYELLLTNTRPILPDGSTDFNHLTQNSLSPSGIHPQVKAMLESSWALLPESRPSADDMVSILEEVVYGGLVSPMRNKERESRLVPRNSTIDSSGASNPFASRLSNTIRSASFLSRMKQKQEV